MERFLSFCQDSLCLGSQAAPPLQCFSFSTAAAQALGGILFLTLSPPSIFLVSDGTNSITQKELEDNFCIFGGMIQQAELLRSHHLLVVGVTQSVMLFETLTPLLHLSNKDSPGELCPYSESVSCLPIELHTHNKTAYTY